MNKLKFLCKSCYVVSELKFSKNLKCPVCGNRIFARNKSKGCGETLTFLTNSKKQEDSQ